MSDLIHYLEKAWMYLSISMVNAGFLVLIVAIYYVLLVYADQGRDFMSAMLQGEKRKWRPPYLFFLCLCMWSYVMWYSACITLQIEPYTSRIDVGINGVIQAFTKKTEIICYGFGTLPFVAVFLSWFKVDRKKKKQLQKMSNNAGVKGHDSRPWPLAIITLAVGAAMVGLFIFLDSNAGDGGWPNLGRTVTNKDPLSMWGIIKQRLGYIHDFPDVYWYFVVLGVLLLIALCIFSIVKTNIDISSMLGPASVTVLSFAFFTFALTVIMFFNSFPQSPVLLIFVAITVLFSRFNDNSEPFYVKDKNGAPRPVAQPHSVKSGFNNWTKDHFETAKANYDPQMDFNPRKGEPGIKKEVPLYFIAAEGGGIRGMKWTGHVFNELNQKTNGRFMQQTFCISGISGGGVGAVMYLAYLKQSQGQPGTKDGQFYKFLSCDQLSPVLTAIAYPTSLQRVLPVPIKKLDRARILGETWRLRYKEIMGDDVLEQGYLDLWQNNVTSEGKPFYIPAMILNGTLAETGQRIMTGSLSLKPDKYGERIGFYEDDNNKNGEITVHAAALNCCRFPVVTAGGLYRRNGQPYGHIIDGGIRENTGLSTLLDVLDEIGDDLKTFNDSQAEYMIKPHVVFVKNGEDYTVPESKAYALAHGVKVPVIGVLKGIGAFRSASFLFNHLKELSKQHGDFRFHFISLDKHNKTQTTFPLGWYLSEKACQAMDEAVKDFKSNNELYRNL